MREVSRGREWNVTPKQNVAELPPPASERRFSDFGEAKISQLNKISRRTYYGKWLSECFFSKMQNLERVCVTDIFLNDSLIEGLLPHW